jgi:S-adenosylmethionine hydrolase
MPVITLTSDWIKDDYYVGAVKGRILSQCPEARIIDLSHRIPSFNVRQAAFIVKNSYTHFPKGTVHIIGINSSSGPELRLLGIQIEDQYFLTYDNGIYGLIFRDEPAEAVELKMGKEALLFPELTLLADTACHLIKGKGLKEMGKSVKNFAKTVPLRATLDDSGISGSIIYIDSYQNAITNITRELFERVRQNRNFEILVQSNKYRINRINNTYGETTTGEILAVFNSVDLLEIAINKGNAAGLLGLDTSSSVRVNFLRS